MSMASHSCLLPFPCCIHENIDSTILPEYILPRICKSSSQCHLGWAGAYSPSTAERLRQTERSKYKTSLGYAVSFRSAWAKVVESYRKAELQPSPIKGNCYLFKPFAVLFVVFGR